MFRITLFLLFGLTLSSCVSTDPKNEIDAFISTLAECIYYENGLFENADMVMQLLDLEEWVRDREQGHREACMQLAREAFYSFETSGTQGTSESTLPSLLPTPPPPIPLYRSMEHCEFIHDHLEWCTTPTVPTSLPNCKYKERVCRRISPALLECTCS